MISIHVLKRSLREKDECVEDGVEKGRQEVNNEVVTVMQARRLELRQS